MNDLNTKGIIRLFKEVDNLNAEAKKKGYHLMADLSFYGDKNPAIDHNGEFDAKIYLSYFVSGRRDRRDIVESWTICDTEPYISVVSPQFNEPGKPWYNDLDKMVIEIHNYIAKL